MAEDSPKPAKAEAAASPQDAERKAALKDKLARLQAAPDDPAFEKDRAIARVKAQIAEL